MVTFLLQVQVVGAANLSSLAGGMPISLATLQQGAAAQAVPGTILAASPQQQQPAPASPLQGQILPGGAQIISEFDVYY